jgi:ubiquitin fusion degradation protein 1
MWNGGGFPFGGHPDDDGYGPGGQGGHGAVPPARTGAFTRQFRAYPVSFIDRADMEKGDKIVLPPSALDSLARLNITYPMLFQLESRDGLRTHCGVLEFVAEEGHANLPYWLMQNLLVPEGGMITIRNANLPKGTYVKFQPQSSDFLAISNPKAVLEATLRGFSCLSKGHAVAITYNEKVYWIDVLEVAPGDAISIIEADVNVDFAPPPDYVEPVPPAEAAAAAGGAPGASGGGPVVGGSAGVTSGRAGAALPRGDPSERLRRRLERLKKPRGARASGTNDDDESDDEDDSDDDSDSDGDRLRGARKSNAQPKERFPGGGQTLKASRTGSGGLLFGAPAAAGTGAAADADSKPESALGSANDKEENTSRKPYEPFAGPGRTLR